MQPIDNKPYDPKRVALSLRLKKLSVIPDEEILKTLAMVEGMFERPVKKSILAKFLVRALYGIKFPGANEIEYLNRQLIPRLSAIPGIKYNKLSATFSKAE